ncbi:hemerythrin domain-containing protein [Micromonospora fluostatini]|uniref:hemerythrin domain-containing protein n=1 Tax=Micromonospora sp. JCM 30529 TaxID=3421643 RepID=UPI003D185D96
MTVHLPPLPPVPGDGYRPAGRSLVDIIEAEHRELLELAGEATAQGTPPPRRREVLDVFTAVLARHLSGEEQYLFPAARQAVPGAGERIDRAIAGDAGLLAAARDLPDGGLPAVVEQLRRHVEGVDALLGPLRAAASEEELIRLGNRLEIAEEAAPTRPHPGNPHTPPWNRIVDPAVGVVDKVRDAVSGRHTHRSDL